MGHLNLLKNALHESSAAVVVLSNTGRVQTLTPEASRLLAKYLGDATLRRGALRESLRRWVARQQIWLNDSSDVPQSREPLVSQYNGGRLFARLFQDQSQSVLLLEESSPAPERIDGFGLTRREGEVLAWVSRGKTNRDISAILGTSPRTVQKHVEHIFQKLGVETRTAAAAKALVHRQSS